MGANRPSKVEPLDARRSTRDDLLNLALDIHMEWGPELGRPEDVRLLERTTGLDPALVDEIVAEARKPTDLANGIVLDVWEKKPTEYDGDAEAAVRDRYPWVDADNLSHLISQANYYAWHG